MSVMTPCEEWCYF